jgi:hypothetical protein
MEIRRLLLSAASAACMALPVLAQQPVAAPAAFHTAARFSIDADVRRLQTAVAISEPHSRFKEYSWVRVYFYAFPLTTADVTDVSTGSIAGLEQKRSQAPAGGLDMNHSRAVLHFLLDKDAQLSNASLEVPGLTCTIVVERTKASSAVQEFRFDGRQLHLTAKGESVCDLTSISGGKRTMSWDVDTTLPVFAARR